MIHTSTQKVVVFRLGNEEFALSIEQVHSIEKSMEVTQIPNMPEFVNGVLHLTGNVFPIIDMRLLLKKEGLCTTDQERIIIVNVGNKKIGLVVDEAKDVLDIPADHIQSMSIPLGQREQSVLVVKYESRLIIFLEIETLLQNLIPM